MSSRGLAVFTLDMLSRPAHCGGTPLKDGPRHPFGRWWRRGPLQWRYRTRPLLWGVSVSRRADVPVTPAGRTHSTTDPPSPEHLFDGRRHGWRDGTSGWSRLGPRAHPRNARTARVRGPRGQALLCLRRSQVGAEGLVCRPGSVPGRLTTHRSATIHLGPPLPTTSCGPPAHSGGQPSSVRCSTLLRAGFTEPIRSPGSLVVSCTTVSPLPQATASGGLFSVALSRGLPRVGVAHRPALRSPDLPRRPRCDRVRRGRPTNPSALVIVGH